MISVEEAQRILWDHCPAVRSVRVPLSMANGRFITEHIRAAHPHPLFDMSAVDGYAFCKDGKQEWTVVGSVAAGEVFPRAINSGESVRIFTGAALPEGADTVVMQERVHRDGDRITHNDTGLKYGGNVRIRGEHVEKGNILVDEGDRLGPALIGLLASVGVGAVVVGGLPRVRVLITGNEFTDASDPPAGRIFGSNDVMLQAALAKELVPTQVEHVGDDTKALSAAILRAVEQGDLLITTGGASVGDHDLIAPVLRELGATIHFHGVAQKPGKPMLFAELNGIPIFGLPGNPRAVLILFWIYVLPFLQRMQCSVAPGLRSDELKLMEPIEIRGDRAEFRAVKVDQGSVIQLKDEGSHMLTSLTAAHALAYFPAEKRKWEVGERVRVNFIQ
ncbi:MAG: molybdopterin molybdotransferase MoeA [Flavobacteriales bacterium]